VARPLTIIMDLTERCNLKCIMCHFSATDRLSFLPHHVKLSEDGNMPLPVFETIAADLFPRARRVALACAAEPMIHPKFREIVAIAGRYGVPELWFPSNLLALTEPTAKALIDADVWTVAASIDGVTKETYEKIRVPAKFERLTANLELLARVKAERRSKRPRLRIIFTWMKSNRKELQDLPAFAQRHGASDLDVRYVTESPGVDNGPELLSGEDPAELRAELARAARDAVRRGLRLASYPDFETLEEAPRNPFARLARRIWRVKAGLDRVEYMRFTWQQRMHGCAYPDRYFVIRPNGAVNPCIYWEGDPIGFYPADGVATIHEGAPLARIRNGLHFGRPVGTCATCSQRRMAFYRLPGAEAAPDPPAALRLPTLPR
jgi:MoaA/NifB/PqqE/SkfB family radical SAM enzyme